MYMNKNMLMEQYVQVKNNNIINCVCVEHVTKPQFSSSTSAFVSPMHFKWNHSSHSSHSTISSKVSGMWHIQKSSNVTYGKKGAFLAGIEVTFLSGKVPSSFGITWEDEISSETARRECAEDHPPMAKWSVNTIANTLKQPTVTAFKLLLDIDHQH